MSDPVRYGIIGTEMMGASTSILDNAFRKVDYVGGARGVLELGELGELGRF